MTALNTAGPHKGRQQARAADRDDHGGDDAGMIPSALGIGDGGEFRAPMAIGVSGGLVVSTLLSLVFVPSFYTVIGDLSGLARRIGLRRRPDLDAAEQPVE
jgi:hypothetical protein